MTAPCVFPNGVEKSQGVRRVLSAGSGYDPSVLWAEQGYKVVRLDIEPTTNPDIVGSMTDMGEIGEFDAVDCCHALEHLYPHQVGLALREFYRVIVKGGWVIIQVPDLEDVRPTEDVLYHNVTGLHLFYGDASKMPEFPNMAHHSGFTGDTLRNALEFAGFRDVTTKRCSFFNLVGIGRK